MAGGGLFDPLGTDRSPEARRAGPSLWLIALIVVLIGFASLFATAAFRNGGDGGEPRVVAGIGPVRHVEPVAQAPASLGSAPGTSQSSGLPGGSFAASDQEVQIENGVRVIRPRRSGATGGSLVVKVPEAAPATAAVSVADDRLLEPGASGPLPRTALDGSRPAEINAGAAGPGATGKPWIAIVVGGFETDPGETAPEPTAWPAGITLGYTVDAAELARQVGSARAAGHEVVLMIPPSQGGASDNAVATAGHASATSAHDRLRWQLSRFTGYAGVVVDSTNQNVATVAADLLEMTRRGLYVVDATSARRPRAPTSGVEATGPAMTTADATLTGSVDSEAPERFLARLAKLARADGSAIGIAPASPRSLAAISRFAVTLADSGMALVPLGAVVSLRQNAQAARPSPVAAP